MTKSTALHIISITLVAGCTASGLDQPAHCTTPAGSYTGRARVVTSSPAPCTNHLPESFQLDVYEGRSSPFAWDADVAAWGATGVGWIHQGPERCDGLYFELQPDAATGIFDFSMRLYVGPSGVDGDLLLRVRAPSTCEEWYDVEIAKV